MIYYYSTVSNNTGRMVEKLPFESVRLSHKDVVTTPFVLFTGTYADGEGKNAVAKPVMEFLRKNHRLMIGVVASGNKNFGRTYGLAGDAIAHMTGKPLLYKFELFGTETDKNNLIKILGEFLNERK